MQEGLVKKHFERIEEASTSHFKGYNLVLENEMGNGVPVSSINKQFSFHPRFNYTEGKKTKTNSSKNIHTA